MHSVRSGFLATTHLIAAKTGKRADWKNIAMIQGWHNTKNHTMMIYAKRALRSAIIASWHLDYDRQPSEIKVNHQTLAVVDDDCLKPKVFHHLSSLKSNWPQNC